MDQVEVLPSPLKSKGDQKTYRLIKLKNGIKAILVRKVNDTSSGSDSEVLAAAALTVGIGSFDDPPNALGLAHFLEHMVHMGSQKYPAESGYNYFLTANGGRRNAMTSSEFTSYFFCVSEKAFPEALDQFAQMFEAPLLLNNSMQREREAVDSEYKMNKSNEAVRCQSIVKTLIKDTHPASRFDFGNLKTLKDDITDDDLHSELLKLQSKYVGNKMFLTLQSKKSLDEMQEMVVKCFSSIISGDEEMIEKPQKKMEELFKSDFYNKIFYVKPKTARKAFMITWALPSVHKHYKCAPLDFMSHIFGNEGEGGISSYLKEKQLITGIGLFMEENGFVSNSDFALARVAVDLTDLGSENIEQIIEAISSYLLMIKETSVEEHRRLYNELSEQTAIDFNFHKEMDSMQNVLDVSTNLLTYDDFDTLRGSSVYQHFDEKIIFEVINALNERKFSLIIITDKHDTFDKKEKYFETEYDEQDMPDSILRIWNERTMNPEFFLEKPNPFKTTNFEVYAEGDETPKYPVNIYENNIIKVWHKLDNKYNRPHVNFRILLLSPTVLESKENYTMMRIYDNLLEFYLTKKLSQASNAGYDVKTSFDRRGLLLSFKGYNDKISLLIDMVTSFVGKCMDEADESTFKTIRDELIENYSEKLMKLTSLNGDITDRALFHNHVSILDVYNQFGFVSFENLQQFSYEFFKQMQIEVLSQGNMAKSQTLNVAKIIEANLKCKQLDEVYEQRLQCYQVPLGSNVIRIKSPMVNDDNSFIKNFYQIGPDSLRVRSLSKLIEAVLSPKAYDYLRSKEQLGYGVGCQLENKGGVMGLSIVVLSQENKHSYAEVCEKMEIFINEISKIVVDELTDEDFESFKEARIKTVTAEHLDLAAEVASNWFEIKEHDYIFDRLELTAKVTKSLTKTELQQFFNSFTQPENIRKLSVQVIGTKKSDESLVEVPKESKVKLEFMSEKLSADENVIVDIKEFQSNLFLYPIVNFKI